VRVLVPVLADAVIVSVPDPVLVAGPAVTHACDDATDHVQDASLAVTVTGALPPPAGIVTDVGATMNVQAVGPPLPPPGGDGDPQALS